jgi:hypothetical protein
VETAVYVNIADIRGLQKECGSSICETAGRKDSFTGVRRKCYVRHSRQRRVTAKECWRAAV